MRAAGSVRQVETPARQPAVLPGARPGFLDAGLQTVAPQPDAAAGSPLDRFLVKRFRSAMHDYDPSTVSAAPGYAGLIEESMHWADLPAAQQQAAVSAHFEGLFGRLGCRVGAWFAEHFPAASARLWTLLTPIGLHFLVGDMARTSPTTVVIKDCAFRKAAGPDGCKMCELRTPPAFADKLKQPMSLSPASDGSCTVRYGAAAPRLPPQLCASMWTRDDAAPAATPQSPP